MKPLICSIYYPHYGLKFILQACVHPMVEKIKNIQGVDLINFRLSTYKGENIVLSFDCPEEGSPDTIRNLIAGSVNDFFSRHPKYNSTVQFPLNRLFMDVPPQTIHFWKSNPFRERMILASDQEADLRIRSLISRYCLWQVSVSTPLLEDKLFNLYIRLLILFSNIVNNNNLHDRGLDFQDLVLSRLKEIKNGSNHAIETLYELSREIYIHNDTELNKIIVEIYDQIENSGFQNMDIPLIHWRGLLDEIENIRSSSRGAEKELFYVDLFFEITQKISLRVDELIKAIAITSEFNKIHQGVARK